MKNENSSIKTSPIGLHLLTIFFVASSMIMERFGTYPNYSNHYGKFAYSELFGIVIPIAIFILPAFVKACREKYWSKGNLIITSIMLILSIFCVLVMYSNKIYYLGLWQESGHWTRDNCPPIRWDFWNIV